MGLKTNTESLSSPEFNLTSISVIGNQVSFISTLLATMKRELLYYWRYKFNLVSGIFNNLIYVFTFAVLAVGLNFRSSSFITNNASSFDNISLFLLSGALLIFLSSAALWDPINTINNELYNGTLEYVFSTPSSRTGYFTGAILATLIIQSIGLLPFFVAIIFIGTSISNLIPIILVLLISMVGFVGIGMMISTTAILWKRTTAIVQLISMALQFLVGGFIPVQSFPVYLQWISFLFPQTFAYDLIRYYAFNGTWVTLAPPIYEWLILIVSTPIYFIFSKSLFLKTEKYAKRQGLHLL